MRRRVEFAGVFLVAAVVLVTVASWPAAAQEGAGVGAGYFVHRGNLALTGTWSHEIIAEPVELNATGLLSSDGWGGAGADTPADTFTRWPEVWHWWKWGAGFNSATKAVKVGVAGMTPMDDELFEKWDWGVYFRLTSEIVW